jgi:hypothetical protein
MLNVRGEKDTFFYHFLHVSVQRCVVTAKTGLLFLIAALVLGSCEDTNVVGPGSGGEPPAVLNASVVPSTVNIDSLVPVNGVYSFQATLKVAATDIDGDLAEVHAYVVGPKSSTQIADGILHDDGKDGDITAHDGIYTGILTLTFPRSMAGPYRVQFVATDNQGLRSGTIDISFRVTRANSPPRLLDSTLVAPDTIVVPGGGTTFSVSIAAADSDGLSDIQSVFFLSLDSSTPTNRIELKDDGGADVNFASGDKLAGDGIFSRVLVATAPPPSPRTFRFLFQAVDSFGDTSATLLHYVTLE